MDPKVTILTVTWNSSRYIRDAIDSVLAQDYPNLEYIVKDAGSTDGTQEIIRSYGSRVRLIVQPDKGMYDALNQGIAASTGEIIAHLNSDDLYASPDIVGRMVKLMEKTGAETGWGNIVYIDGDNKDKIVRRFDSSPYVPGRFRWGWHPPHTSFFVRKSAYQKYGVFRTDMKVAADYELMLRLLVKNRVSSCYLPEVVVKMRTGGLSGSWLGRLSRIRREDARAWRLNGLKGGFLTAWLLKPLSKIPQLFA